MSVLIIDDGACVERMSAPLASLTGDSVLSATDLASALKAIESQNPRMVISGLPLTNDLGMTLLLWVSARHPGLPVVVLVEDLTDELAQQAQWFGARGTLAKSTDTRALTDGLAAVLGIAPKPVDSVACWEAVAAAHQHLALVAPYVPSRVEAHSAVAGLFRGLGAVRGHLGTYAIDSDGTLLDWNVEDPSVDVRATAAMITSMLPARGDDAQPCTDVLRSGTETYVVTCTLSTRSPAHHAHIVTVVADGGNRALVQLAHKRMRRELSQVSRTAAA